MAIRYLLRCFNGRTICNQANRSRSYCNMNSYNSISDRANCINDIINAQLNSVLNPSLQPSKLPDNYRLVKIFSEAIVEITDEEFVDGEYRKWIKGYEGKLSIDRDGNAFSHYMNKISMLSKVSIKDKYVNIHTKVDGKIVAFAYHRAMAEAFIPNPENKPYVNHINGKKHDYSIENLEWSTASENRIHALKTGLVKDMSEKAKKHCANVISKRTALFTLDEASEILEMMSVLKLTQEQTADLVGCHKTTIQNLCRGKTKYFKDGNIAI